MVKRDVETKLAFSSKDDAIETDERKDKESVRMPLTRNRRAIRMFHGSIGKLSPLSVTDAANYDEQKNKGWVKPLFSSIVYRLPVSSELFGNSRRSRNDGTYTARYFCRGDESPRSPQ